ncbi:hypothetical protein BGX27_004609 [Mortierella sp. AM989]|nr:hypothetical protein BGX27_004609 [Mortierella sp. AM989]
MITTSSISQQSFHSQSSLSDKSTVSNSSGGSGSGASLHTTTIPTRSVTGGTIESLSHHGLQRFPTGENEYKIKSKSKSGDQSTRQSHDGQIKASRTTSTVSSSSARSSSGNSGFKFTKPNLTFKPLLYNQGNDSKSQQSLYKHTNNSSSSASPNGQQQMPDLLANSPFPSILLSIRLPQSLLNKYVIDQESFRQGKGIWGIGRYSCTISVLSKTTGKKYVIKRVSKSLLPPSAYYHYPTTAHRLCTCPACKASRDHLLMTGQLEGHELEKIKEVLVIQNRGKKDLPQLPPSSPPHHQQKHPQRPLSASSISPPSQKETKEKRRSFNMYNNYNASMPNHHVKFLTFSSNSSPHNTPANSRPTTPSPSPLRLFSSPVPSSPPPMSPSGKTHNRSHSQSCPATSQNAQSHNNPHSPLLPSATPLSWPHKESESQVSQTSNAQFYADISSGSYSARPPVQTRVSHSSYSQKKRPALKRHASTPNMSRPVTGLKVLEDDPSRLDQLKQLSRHGWHPQDSKDRHGQREAHPYESGTERRLFDSPFNTTSTMPSSHMVTKVNTQDRDSDDENTYERLQCKISKGIEREVDPFDTNGGEFKTMDPASPKLTKPAELPGFVPPPHALPMELVLLQTYNDSDHLPEHHEWTQDKEYWYYVTKSHGVRRRKLKKVSTWWLDVGSLGSAFTIGSSSNEPIATKPIYNMGHSTGDSTPIPSESPLSSEMALSNAFSSASATGQGQVADDCHTPKQSISSITSQDSYASSIGAPFKRQSSPRNSHMGKYFYVDWDEYTSL